jgi:hypothetical protein
VDELDLAAVLAVPPSARAALQATNDHVDRPVGMLKRAIGVSCLRWGRHALLATILWLVAVTSPVVTTVNTKNWYKRGTDLWARFGDRSRSTGEDFFRRFGRDACGWQFVSIRQRTICADFARSRGDVARTEGTNGWITFTLGY